MKIEFRLNFRDYQEANKANLKQQKFIYYSLWLFCIAAIVSAIFPFLIGDVVGGIVSLLFGMIIGIVINPETGLSYKITLKKSWDKQSKVLHQPMEIEGTKESLVIQGESFSGTIQWKVFEKFIETENLFVIYEGKMLFRIIPKRAFDNNDELREFKMLLQENIKPTEK